MTLLEDLYNIFIRPISEAVGKIIEPIIEAITPDEIETAAINASTAFQDSLKGAKLGFSTKSPGVPEDLAQQAEAQLLPIEGAFMAQTIANIVAESVSLGQVDITVNELANTPSIQASKQTAMAIRRAEFVEGVYPALRRYHLKHFLPLLPETYRLALAAAKGISMPMSYTASMAESGLSPEWAEVWLEQNYEYPSFAQLAELRWRGVIDDKVFTLWMQRTGAKPETIEALKNLMVMIPPAQDLVTMVVREAFDKRYVTPAPDVFAQYMAMKGFSGEWSDRYWTMHWAPIPLSQAYANLHRGFWKKEQFLEALRIADLHPQWREDVYNVAFGPPSIREMGYGYDVGEYTFNDIVQYRRWGGLSEGDAIKAAKSMVAYRTEAEREAVRREHLHLFALGKETEESFRDNLARLGTNAIALELWIERGKLEADRIAKESAMPEQRITSSSEALWAFEHKLQTEAVTREQLLNLNWVPSRINLAIERSKFEMAEAEAKEKEVTFRELTIAQIRDLYKAGKITREQMPALLLSLKYRPAEAKILADVIADVIDSELKPRKLTITEVTRLYDFRLLGVSAVDAKKSLDAITQAEGPMSPAKALYDFYQNLNYESDDAVKLTLWTIINLNLPDIKAMYSKGWINATVMVNEFVKLGLPINRANDLAMTIVKAEQPTRTVAERDLTKSEIIKGAKQGILSPAQASELLQGLGYDANEALYILYINAVVERGDPEGYWEMRKVIEQSKKSRGEKYTEIPDELITLELQIKDAKAKIEQMKKEKVSDEIIAEAVLKLGGLESRVKTLVIAYKIV